MIKLYFKTNSEVIIPGIPTIALPRKIVPRLGLEFWSRLGVGGGGGGGGGDQTTALEENCPLVSVRVWVRVSLGVGGRKTLFAFDYTCLI